MTWEVKKMGEITTKIGSGATPRGGQKSYKTEGISLIRSMNVHDRYFKEKNLAFIDDEQANDLSNVTLQANDVLLNITGASIARCCIVPDKYLPARVNQHVSIIRPNPEIMDSSFLNLLLTSKYYKDQLLFTGEQGSTRQAITKVQLQDFIIHYPPLTEQKRIVAILDEAFENIARAKESAEKNLKNANEIFESYLQSVFENKGEGWEEIKLQDLSNNYKKDIVDGPFGSDLKRSHYLTFGVPVLKLQNVKQGRFELKNLDYVSPEKALSLKRHAFQSGDIVMTKLGAPLGVSAIVQNMVDGIIVADLVRIRAQKINTDYLCYFLNSPKIRKFINSKQKGTTRPRIRLSVVRELPILFPKNEKDQQSIVAKLNTLSAETKKLEAIYTQKLADLEELKKSILAKAFKGELTEVSI